MKQPEQDALVERLRKPVDADKIYDWIVQKREETTSDLPRQGFQIEMELIDEERAEAAAAIVIMQQTIAAHREIGELTGGQQERKRADIMFTSNAELRATLMTRDGIISQLRHTIAAHRKIADALANSVTHDSMCNDFGPMPMGCSCSHEEALTAYRAAMQPAAAEVEVEQTLLEEYVNACTCLQDRIASRDKTISTQAAEVERLRVINAGLVEVLHKIMPIRVEDGPDYAQVYFDGLNIRRRQ